MIELSKKVNDIDESPARSASLEDDIELDFVEHDINVCDICGDAGNEDLLATCSKCSDGAEHTYCMREMMDKIPDATWLCEDCKLFEATENENLDKVEIADTMEKDLFLEHESNVHNSVSKLENKHNTSEIQRLNNTDVGINEVVNLVSNLTRKRCLDNTDCGPASKKPALSSVAESEEAYSIGKITAISEESLQKDIDKNQIKQPTLMSRRPQISTGILSPIKSSDNPQYQASRGILAKSSSFSSTNPSKSKLVEEPLSKKSNGIREQDTSEVKDNHSKLIGRSTSFKSPFQSKGKVLFFDGFTDNNLKSWKLKNRRKPEEKKQLHSYSSSAFVSEPSSIVPVTKMNPPPPCGSSKSGSKIVNTACEANMELLSSSSPRIGTLPENVHTQFGVKDDDFSGIELPLKDAGDGQVDFGVSHSHTITSHGKGSRDNKHEDSKLKAAIEAAFLKKPVIYNRRKKSSNLSTQIPESEVKSDTEAAFLDHFERQSYLTNTVSSDEVHGCSTCTTIPLRDYIWQGSFEVHRNCRTLDLFDGVQAHVSASASSKVVDIMCKVSNKLELKEVSQLSVWPKQFHHIGVKDDNIALYFFARDTECYEGHYKRLLDNLMMNNLALKGSFDGVELLIFPSSHLPEKSHCWNMLYFLWGVFRLSVKDLEFGFLQKSTPPSCNVVSQENPPYQINCVSDGVNDVEYCKSDNNVIVSHCVSQPLHSTPQAMKSILPMDGIYNEEAIESKTSIFQYPPPSPLALHDTSKIPSYIGEEVSGGGGEKCRDDGDEREENNEMLILHMDKTLNNIEGGGGGGGGGGIPFPDLELALGAERKTPKNVSFTDKQSDDTSSLSLSLSLSHSLSGFCSLNPQF